jgi:ferric-dicitrate binding protein FerR (iron transport regulator)
MFEDKDDTILARWLAGGLTPEELAEFQKTEAFLEYQYIANSSSRFLKPTLNKEALYEKIKANREQVNTLKQKKTKVITLKRMVYTISIAASLLLLVGFLFNTVSYETAIGEQLAVTLPDGSKVQLNANSKLEHSRFFWNNNRNVLLNGEGFFTVTSGNKFTVETNLGNVNVLGTQFNVRARAETINVYCYEGKVQFKDAKTNDRILTAGQSIMVIEGTLENQKATAEKPSWLSGISTFDNVLLSDVLNELQTQYNIVIKTNTIDVKQRFSGNIVHNNIEIALQTVFKPMNIKYTLNNNVLELTAP